ncbi:MAG: S-layer homology domain-containing protein, partial [Acutalibacter sp.]|nr:S-layer homology domain-containing protein [Acutalibacter sp.]
MKQGKRILSVLLAVLLLASCLPMMASAAETAYYKGAPDGGTYTISTAAQLKALAETVNGGEDYENTTFALTQDIDLNGSVNNQWTPIGDDFYAEFSGIFDGDNCKITGLYIDAAENWYQGLFGSVSEDGIIKNLTVDGFVTGRDLVGGVAGCSAGKMENCSFFGNVTGGQRVGGVVGQIGNSTVINCYNTGKVTCTGYYGDGDWNRNIEWAAGGIVGENRGGTVRNCYNIGVVTGITDGCEVGGIVGVTYNSGVVSSCYNTGNISGRGDSSVGGIVGTDGGGTMTSCYNIGNVTGGQRVGGVLGWIVKSTILNCYYLAGKASGGINGKDVSDQAETLTADAFRQTASFKNWDFSGTWDMGKDASGNPVRPIFRSLKEGNLQPLFSDSGDDNGSDTGLTFVDVPSNAYYYNAVEWAAGNNIVAGTSDTTFSPNQNCTRGQIVTFLWRAAGKPEPKTAVNPFTDLKSSEYYYKAVLW